ncbi:hypothetical protein BDR26DRAFT_871559 [Obelidium mucronatum]|nr:hypothetical protein BDR26DRAFT_871559 [Obelidium mucronatum]
MADSIFSATSKEIFETDQRLEPTPTMSEQPEKPSSAIVLQDSYLSFNGSRLVLNGEPVFQEYLFDTQESGYSINYFIEVLGLGDFYKDGVFKKIKASNHHFKLSWTLLTHKSLYLELRECQAGFYLGIWDTSNLETLLMPHTLQRPSYTVCH